jgi:hypothetical protein
VTNWERRSAAVGVRGWLGEICKDVRSSHFDKFSLRCCKISSFFVKVYTNFSFDFATRYVEFL